MMINKHWIPLAAFALLAGHAAAQTPQGAEDSEGATAGTESEAREAELARRLDEAERRMAEAAREIAELTSERLPNLSRRIEVLHPDRPRLGVTIGDDSDGPVEGVKVLGVTPGSAAAEAGLRTGDILTAVNGESLSADGEGEAVNRLLDFMDGVEAGDALDIEYLRDGKVATAAVEPRAIERDFFAFRGQPGNFTAPRVPDVHIAPGVADRYANVFEFSWVGNAWGDMELVDLNDGLGKYFGTDEGVLVVKAPKADALQLQDGDVIQSIDGREPTSTRHAIRILSSYQPGEKLQIVIMREKRKRTLDIEMPDNRSSYLMTPAAPLVRPAMQAIPAPRPALPAERT